MKYLKKFNESSNLKYKTEGEAMNKLEEILSNIKFDSQSYSESESIYKALRRTGGVGILNDVVDDIFRGVYYQDEVDEMVDALFSTIDEYIGTSSKQESELREVLKNFVLLLDIEPDQLETTNKKDDVSMKKFVVTTTSESSDHYIYFIEHPTEPTSDELQRFLRKHGSDFDDERTYEYVEDIEEIKNFQKIPE